ncbi:MAG: hypothetical protein JWQ18_2918 [Conexibacter sp.]|nr:hypothetical protein [Conexibacter sp.]
MLRPTLTTAAILVAALLPAATAAAKLPTLASHQVSSDAEWLGAADATTAAYRSPVGRTLTGGVAWLRPDAGPTRPAPVPAGCTAQAAGSGRIASNCGDTDVLRTPSEDEHWLWRIAVTSLSGGEEVQLDQTLHTDAGGSMAARIDWVGAQWVRSIESGYHATYHFQNVNWRTGEQRSTRETDPAQVVDLDAPGLYAPMCPPLHATVQPDTDSSDEVQELAPALRPVTVRGGWALITRATYWSDFQSAKLYRCGSGKAIALPRGFGGAKYHEAGGLTLGDGWLAVYRPDGMRLLRLADRRQFKVSGAPGAAYFTEGRLYVVSGHLPAALRTVVLPQR